MNGGSGGDVVPRAVTQEELMERLSSIAQEKGDDFRIQVSRKQTSEGLEHSVAVFAGAKLAHFAAPETWLVPLAGGGPYYVLSVWHERNPNKLIAKINATVIPGPAREVDIYAPTRANWNGPSVLIFPTAADRAAETLPGVSTGRAASQPASQGGTGAGQTSPSGDAAGLAQAQHALLEARMRLEIDAMKAESVAAAKRMEAAVAQVVDLVKTFATSAAQRPPQPSLVEQLAPLIAAAAPIVTAFTTKSESDRKFFAEIEDRRAQRDAATAAEREKRETVLLEKIGSQSAETAKTFSSMSEVVSSSMRAQMQMIATLQDLRPGEPGEEPWVGVVKEAIRAFAEVASKPPQPALPPAGAGTPANGGGQPTDDNTVSLDKAEPQEIIDEIVEMLKAKTAAREVCALYVEALKTNAAFVQHVKAHGGTGKTFQAALGAWIAGEGNGAYLGQVFGTLATIAKEQGVTA